MLSNLLQIRDWVRYTTNNDHLPVVSVKQVDQIIGVVDIDGRPVPGGTLDAPCAQFLRLQVVARVPLHLSHPAVVVRVVFQPDHVRPLDPFVYKCKGRSATMRMQLFKSDLHVTIVHMNTMRATDCLNAVKKPLFK